jgi:hypothetical protein
MNTLRKGAKFIFYEVITVFIRLYGRETSVNKENTFINVKAQNGKMSMTV